MAFAAGARWDCAGRLLAALERRLARPWGANHDMTRLVGLPACRAIVAFGRGDFDACERLLRGLPPVAHRIGGSHAQRDVLQLTRSAAAARRARPGLRRAA
jgi:ATP/maltotriose-dependent transcriptional regulator MalT